MNELLTFIVCLSLCILGGALTAVLIIDLGSVRSERRVVKKPPARNYPVLIVHDRPARAVSVQPEIVDDGPEPDRWLLADMASQLQTYREVKAAERRAYYEVPTESPWGALPS